MLSKKEKRGFGQQKRFLVIKYLRRWFSETGGERRLEGGGRWFKGLHHHQNPRTAAAPPRFS